MTNEERDIQRKLKVLQHAEKIGNARKACRYFGIGRSSFYRWRDAYQKHGEANGHPSEPKVKYLHFFKLFLCHCIAGTSRSS
ncbi:Helix-turn-helix domain-containing protein [Pacificibacter marinus]|uniref:Insertion element IS150 protein InsJ-like helix-turn-helix domain-containing protein n=1 Tax=Pacificibacter marinus TaxID=658057 RepID=A0A1Y5RYU3_9RHOB|nr:Helix-turn-helix domain-containing protein [Pacificibacter marinus]SLN27606.1 hypothetical protein PAM7971_01070 [Pacificibacter marinus]